MKFEDALAQMRLGKKITHDSLGEDVYFKSSPPAFEKNKKLLGYHVVKMRGDTPHEDMWLKKIDGCGCHFYPTLNIQLLLNENWKILE